MSWAGMCQLQVPGYPFWPVGECAVQIRVGAVVFFGGGVHRLLAALVFVYVAFLWYGTHALSAPQYGTHASGGVSDAGTPHNNP